MIEESNRYPIRTITLSNEFFSIRILPGKGGDINQIWWRARSLSLLYVKEENFSRYQHRNLYENPLKHYSEDDTGGWQDVVPGFGRYGDWAITEAPIGIAATVGWDVSFDRAGEEETVILSADLPVFPLHMEKRIWLDQEGINLEETISNTGDSEADITWTQHAMFGGDFLDENVEISYPSDEILLSALWARQGGPMEHFIHGISEVPMPDGQRYDLRRMRERREDGILVYTMKIKNFHSIDGHAADCPGDLSAGCRYSGKIKNFHSMGGCCELYNRHKNVGLRMLWDQEMFPYLRCCYQNTKNAYALGIEPCNYYYSSFAETDRERMYLHLGSGEMRKTKLRLELFERGK